MLCLKGRAMNESSSEYEGVIESEESLLEMTYVICVIGLE